MEKPTEYQLECLLCFALHKEMIETYDIVSTRNALLDLLACKEPYQLAEDERIDEPPETASDILEHILNDCAESGLIENSLTARDLMDARIMGLLMPRASETVRKFNSLYDQSPKAATDYFYRLSRDSNYIQVDRINKNWYWLTGTEFGDLEITVNLSKPEKDPKEIAAAKLAPQTNYPKCLLCAENEGFAGNLNHPARQNLRLIPVILENSQWYFQYSPYVYYNEHCIVLNAEHTPMVVSRESFKRLFGFVEKFPHYFVGTNADLPIVGGSILTHDHYQGGNHIFPMEKAESYAEFRHKAFDGIRVSMVKWPMTVLRISCTEKNTDKNALAELAVLILNKWKEYSDEVAGILAFSGDIPHNAVTPIARKNKDGYFEADIVLRNNRATEEFPMGIFHPHQNLHHIKKENIGLIEVMGLAVLPGRLACELEAIRKMLAGAPEYSMDEIRQDSNLLNKHYDWIVRLLARYGTNNGDEAAEKIVRDETGNIFMQVLGDAGVFKYTPQGIAQFEKFVLASGFEKQ